MPWVNYKEIKACVKMEQVLEHYGVLGELHEKGDELVGRCPIHKGTNATQFHASRTLNIFHCFGNCHEGGNVIDFVVMMEGGDKKNGDDVRAAAMRMQEWFGLTFERPQGGRRITMAASAAAAGTASVATSSVVTEAPASSQPTLPLSKHQDGNASGAELARTANIREGGTDTSGSSSKSEATNVSTVVAEPVNPPLKFALKRLDATHPYLTERGFTPETIAHFGLGHYQKGIMAGRIAIPIHNEQGELVGYAGRWPGSPPEGEGKYKFPTGFHKLQVVFNLHRAREHTNGNGLIVVEGFFDAMRLWQAGFPNAVALMGSVLSAAQEELIVKTVGPGGKVALMFDEDEAGWKGREDALSRLSSRVHVKVIGLGEEGTQPDTVPEAEIQRYLHSA
jgi:DNA primase